MKAITKEFYKWYKTLTILCVVSACITFTLFLYTKYNYYTNTYSVSVSRFWASCVLTIVFGITSVTVKKIHKCLLLAINNYSSTKILESESEDSIAQQKCPKCGDLHDIDYPKCPFCKYDYNSKK